MSRTNSPRQDIAAIIARRDSRTRWTHLDPVEPDVQRAAIEVRRLSRRQRTGTAPGVAARRHSVGAVRHGAAGAGEDESVAGVAEATRVARGKSQTPHPKSQIPKPNNSPLAVEAGLRLGFGL